MATLPARPDLDHLRREARDLLRAAQAGDADATSRIHGVASRLNLAAAQLAVAREYGFASWPRLKTAVEARTKDLAEQARLFCIASVRDWTGKAARMLAARPELAGYSFATAVVLGDVERVRRDIERDPGLATRPDDEWGWLPLHAACASRWHRLDPSRADGLEAVARLLLEAGADPNPRAGGGQPDIPFGWTPLGCAIAGDLNQTLAQLLLERGAIPDDRDLYHAGFADDDHRLLRLLLDHTPDMAFVAEMALAAPMSSGDTEGVRLLLEAGAEPGRFVDDAEPPAPVLYAAVRTGCPADLVELLLAHGADLSAVGPDGRSPYALAVSRGRSDIAEVLRTHGAGDDASAADRLLSACLHGDAEEAHRQLAGEPRLVERLTGDRRGEAMTQAAETGNVRAIGLMLDLGFPIESRGENGGTALHAASYAGSIAMVRLLMGRGADLESCDTSWDDTPLGWAIVGSGFEPDTDPAADWVGTVELLIQAGARTDGIELSPDDPKPPSAAVADYLRDHGIGAEGSSGGP